MVTQKSKIAVVNYMFWLLSFSFAISATAWSAQMSPNDTDAPCVGSDHRRLESGSWKGVYTYPNGKSVDQLIAFHLNGSALTGEGSDAEIGSFTLSGTYTRSTGKISFEKRYSTHTVQYDGALSDGSMSGNWSLPGLSGTFQFSALCKKDDAKKAAPSQAAPALLLQ